MVFEGRWGRPGRGSIDKDFIPPPERRYAWGYFTAQEIYGRVSAHVTGEPLLIALRDRTKLIDITTADKSQRKQQEKARRIRERFDQAGDSGLFGDDHMSISGLMNDLFTTSPANRFENPAKRYEHYFGGPGYDYDRKTHTVHMQIEPPQVDPEDPFSSLGLHDYDEKLRALYVDVLRRHPDAARVITQGWYLSDPRYQAFLPEGIAESAIRIRPPRLSYKSDDLWGQFIEPNPFQLDTLQEFRANLRQAQTREDLDDSFPFPPLYSDLPIEEYYDKYAITPRRSTKSERPTGRYKEWDKDFRYQFYGTIIEALRDKGFTLSTLTEAEKLVGQGVKTAIIRHDVDVSLEKALELARVELEMGVKATYMIIPNSPLYQVSRDFVRQLVAMEHEVGMHFDISTTQASESGNIEDAILAIKEAKAHLEEYTGQPIQSVSFHRPPPSLLGGNLRIAGMLNAHSPHFTREYLTDADRSWKEGNPVVSIEQTDEEVVQVTTDPVWWDTTNRSKVTALGTLFSRADDPEVLAAALEHFGPRPGELDRYQPDEFYREGFSRVNPVFFEHTPHGDTIDDPDTARLLLRYPERPINAEQRSYADMLRNGNFFGIPIRLQELRGRGIFVPEAIGILPDAQLLERWRAEPLTDTPILESADSIAETIRRARESFYGGRFVTVGDIDNMWDSDFSDPAKIQRHFGYLERSPFHVRRVEMLADLGVHGIRSKLLEKGHVTVIDMGSGIFTIENAMLNKLTPDERRKVTVVGVDVAEDLLRYGLESGKIDKAIQTDLSTKSTEEFHALFPDADVVIYSEILEHIPHLGAKFEENSAPWLRDNHAYVVGSVPNAINLVELIPTIMGNGAPTVLRRPILDPKMDHYSHITAAMLSELLLNTWHFQEAGITSQGVALDSQCDVIDLNAGLEYPHLGLGLLFWAKA